MRRAARVAAVALFVLAARSGAARAQAALAEAPAAVEAPVEKWPLEAVRRPLTLPDGMTAFSLALSGFRPDRISFVDPSTGAVIESHSSATLGFNLALGVDDRFQVSIGAPQLLCFETDAPSGCTGRSRYYGSGAALRALAFRGEYLQVAPNVRISVSETARLMMRWWAGTAVKLTASRVALMFSPIVTRNFGTTVAQPSNPWLAYLPFGLSVQLAQRLLAHGAVQPWGSIGDIEQGIALQFHGGVSYTFGRSGEVDLAGGVYNVLERPTWYRSLGGSYVQLTAAIWRY